MAKTPLFIRRTRILRFCPFSVMIVAKKRGLVYFFLQPVLDHIIQRIRRDGEVGQLVDEREDAGPAHGDARDAGVALRLAGLREDLHAIALGTAAKHAVIEQIIFQMQRKLF